MAAIKNKNIFIAVENINNILFKYYILIINILKSI